MSKRVSDSNGKEEIFYDANENFSNEKNVVRLKPGGFKLSDERIKSVKDQTERENEEHKEIFKLYQSAFGEEAPRKFEGKHTKLGKIKHSRIVQKLFGAPLVKDPNRARLKKKKHTKKRHTKKRHIKKRHTKKRHIKKTRRKNLKK